MGFSILKRNDFNRFLFLTKKDFKKGLLEREKEAFKRLLETVPAARKYLDVSKRLDRDLKREGKKTIPPFDQAEEIIRRCGIQLPSES